MRKALGIVVGVLTVVLGLVMTPAAQAAAGSTLRTFHPQPSGNGRALAFDPETGHLFYTNFPDRQIYVTTTSGVPIQTLTPGLNMYGALSWQPTGTGGVLWGGRYDGSGWVDQINPATGKVTPKFRFAFPAGDSCYNQPPGLIDGLAYDSTDGTLWLGDDGAHTFFHVTTTGAVLGTFQTPAGLCRSGMAASSKFLWLGLQSGPDTGPYSVGRVAKTDPSILLDSLPVNDQGPEGLALDRSTFAGQCALWISQFGTTTTLTARQLPKSTCHGVSDDPPPPQPSVDSVGLLTFHVDEAGIPSTIHGCTAAVVNSANLSTIVTAAHCFTYWRTKLPGSTISHIEFAPAHSGDCIQPGDHDQVFDVAACGTNPFGVWHARNFGDVYQPPGPQFNGSDDVAFVVIRRPFPFLPRVQDAVGGHPITWDYSDNPFTDPLQAQSWQVFSYAADDFDFVHITIASDGTQVYGPFACVWQPMSPSVDFNPLQIYADAPGPCLLYDPSPKTFGYPSHADVVGTSGSPWINLSNSPDHSPTIGAITCCGDFLPKSSTSVFVQGNKLGLDAENAFVAAESVHVG
jgi:hypothetical protein